MAGFAERRRPYYVLARRLRSASELEVSNHDEAESASLLVPRWARMPQGFRAFAFLPGACPCAHVSGITFSETGGDAEPAKLRFDGVKTAVTEYVPGPSALDDGVQLALPKLIGTPLQSFTVPAITATVPASPGAANCGVTATLNFSACSEPDVMVRQLPTSHDRHYKAAVPG